MSGYGWVFSIAIFSNRTFLFINTNDTPRIIVTNSLVFLGALVKNGKHALVLHFRNGSFALGTVQRLGQVLIILLC